MSIPFKYRRGHQIFTGFAIELVTLAVDFVPLSVEFGTFAVEFVALALQFVALAMGIHHLNFLRR